MNSKWSRLDVSAKTALLAFIVLFMAGAHAAATDLADVPLQTATTLKPNILFVLDDSDSMQYRYMPDYVQQYDPPNKHVDQLGHNSAFNRNYYDPARTYIPAVRADGTSYPQWTDWGHVPVSIFDTSDTRTQDQRQNAEYYTFNPGEYCSDKALRNCVLANGPTNSNPYPALVRWCTSAADTNTCQAKRLDKTASATPNTEIRYPGMTINGTTVPGSFTRTLIRQTQNKYPKAATRTDCAGTTCTYAEEMTNFANWYAYYGNRLLAMQTVTTLAFAGLDGGYRVGYMTTNNSTGTDFININDFTDSQKTQWYSKLLSAKSLFSTPLRTALATAGRYYAGQLYGQLVNGVLADDPVQYACQRNYTILSTDGFWTSTTNPKQMDGVTDIGDQDANETPPYKDGTATANTLADVAEYYWKTDLRDQAKFGNGRNAGTGVDVSSNSVPDMQQRMYTYTVGLGVSGLMTYDPNYATSSAGDYYDVLNATPKTSATQQQYVCPWQGSGHCTWPAPAANNISAIDDLWHAAVNGRGKYYSASSPAELTTALASFLQSAAATTANGAAATISNPNTVAGDGFVFRSTYRSGSWFGELARYSVDVGTGQLQNGADWSESGTFPSSQNAKVNAEPKLDNLDPASRNIYTYDPTNRAATLVPFTWAGLQPALQSYFMLPAISSLSQLCTSGARNCAPLAASARVNSNVAGTNTGAGGINLVNFLRGDRSNEGPDTTTYYFQRTHVLGDIVDSQAVYVRAPMQSYADPGYGDFKARNANRQKVVYVGANDGMLHAFDATTGGELWAYIPSMLLPNLYKLADKQYAKKHFFYVNATPQQADVYFDGNWHTILVGGLGKGGRGFYALDITDPAAPKVLWEFTGDPNPRTGYTTDADLGYSYGTPVISKLSDGTWAVFVTSGYNNIAPGSGHGIFWVLNAKNGNVIKKVDTSVGKPDSPAGLARMAGFAGNWAINNRVTRLYAGDLLGNVWRFDVSKLTAAGGEVSTQLLATLKDAQNAAQPVTTVPQLALADDRIVVYLGTGSLLGTSDLVTTGLQSIYAIGDPQNSGAPVDGALYGTPRQNVCTKTLIKNCFVQQVYADSGSDRTATRTVDYQPNFNTMYGWFADLPARGERINTDPALQLGTLVFTTNVLSSDSVCGQGTSNVVRVDYKTGLAVPGEQNVGGLLTAETGTALAAAPTLVRLTNGRVVAEVSLSNGTVLPVRVPVRSLNAPTRRISWRELVTQ